MRKLKADKKSRTVASLATPGITMFVRRIARQDASVDAARDSEHQNEPLALYRISPPLDVFLLRVLRHQHIRTHYRLELCRPSAPVHISDRQLAADLGRAHARYPVAGAFTCLTATECAMFVELLTGGKQPNLLKSGAPFVPAPDAQEPGSLTEVEHGPADEHRATKGQRQHRPKPVCKGGRGRTCPTCPDG